MRLTFDPEVDAAYLRIGDDAVPAGAVARTVELSPAPSGVQIQADYDGDGELLGFEIVGASAVLSEAVLRGAARP